MAVLSTNLLYAENPTLTSEGHREYSAFYRVITSSRNDSAIFVRQNADVPQFNDSYAAANDQDFGAYVVGYGVTLEDPTNSLTSWIVRVDYSSRPRRENDDVGDDPLNRPPIISGDGILRERVVTEDKDGNPYVNTADEPFLDSFRDAHCPTLQIQKNFASIDLDQFAEFTDAVNTETFFGLSTRKWKMQNPRWVRNFRGNKVPYFTVTFAFEANRDTWDFKPMDRGTFHLVSSVPTKFMVERRPAEFGLLNGINGTALSAGADPEFLNYRVYPEKDFGELGIPTGF